MLGRGWHGDSKRHAEAARGESSSGSNKKGIGRGWHRDSAGHAKAAKGESPKSTGTGFFSRFRQSRGN
jgi:hypothetical protein